MPAERSTGKASGRVSTTAKSSKSATASTSKKGGKSGVSEASSAATGPPLQENSDIWTEAARDAKRARGGKAMSASVSLTFCADHTQSTARA